MREVTCLVRSAKPKFVRLASFRLTKQNTKMQSSQNTVNDTLHEALLKLRGNHVPFLQNPPGCHRRASVACIIRIRPNSSVKDHHKEPVRRPTDDSKNILDNFFDQRWVRNGNPEILFIRRASRESDRWTAQVALPGGKRDPHDHDDQATSIRETQEEVGLDLASDSVAYIGRLPGRIITTEWGSVPLMVLNPFVYLMLDPKGHPLRLQADEIASAHWVPLHALMDPTCWTYETADTSDRYAKREGPLFKYALRASLGYMLFGAISLSPSESSFATDRQNSHRSVESCNETNQIIGDVPLETESQTLAFQGKPLLLWGLTHGIIIDLLRLMPESNILNSWIWPTFSALDVRFAVWLLSSRFRRLKERGVLTPTGEPFVVLEEGFASLDFKAFSSNALNQKQSSIQPDTSNRDVEVKKQQYPSVRSQSAIHYMLHGYYDYVQRGIALAMIIRIAAGLGLVGWLAKRNRWL